jgi:hypothetical protein
MGIGGSGVENYFLHVLPSKFEANQEKSNGNKKKFESENYLPLSTLAASSHGRLELIQLFFQQARGGVGRGGGGVGRGGGVFS